MAEEDWKKIQQIHAAIADLARLRGDSLEIINHSNQLLRMIDLMNKPLMGVPTPQ
jgi:hypothetical protein